MKNNDFFYYLGNNAKISKASVSEAIEIIQEQTANEENIDFFWTGYWYGKEKKVISLEKIIRNKI
jgi:hypothetical protein